MPPAYFDFIINHKGKVARLSNIDPEKYCYFDLFADVSEKLLSRYPTGLGLAISIFCELPGTRYRIDLNSDKSLIDMFHLDGVPSTLNLFVEMESSNPCQVEHPSEVDGEDVEVVDATQNGHVYGYNDEDDDWNLDREGEVESDDGGRLMVEISGVDDEGLSDYQLGDDEGNMSSGSDEGTEHGTGFDTSYNGKEPYVGCEREVVLEEKMIFPDVDAFRAKLRDYTMEKGFKIVRDKNEKARVTAHCDVEGCPWRIHASPLPDGITYQIKTYTPEHTCTRVNHNEDANSTWIAKKLLKDFKENPQLDLDGIPYCTSFYINAIGAPVQSGASVNTSGVWPSLRNKSALLPPWMQRAQDFQTLPPFAQPCLRSYEISSYGFPGIFLQAASFFVLLLATLPRHFFSYMQYPRFYCLIVREDQIHQMKIDWASRGVYMSLVGLAIHHCGKVSQVFSGTVVHLDGIIATSSNCLKPLEGTEFEIISGDRQTAATFGKFDFRQENSVVAAGCVPMYFGWEDATSYYNLGWTLLYTTMNYCLTGYGDMIVVKEILVMFLIIGSIVCIVLVDLCSELISSLVVVAPFVWGYVYATFSWSYTYYLLTVM
ncbi:hypothetical protein RHSIM_Rhsim04G0200600 [Rhododendron simsii]|uniref:Transposase MuDR plant domain-containing protein n=1 Tax=Rhododendron simsii TaxID=118357 RepID=A0A834H6L4_RHOSS|nr:hypothetical protein RHSIM_Rhsim04G0200600 [Rhododendron simsii]